MISRNLSALWLTAMKKGIDTALVFSAGAFAAAISYSSMRSGISENIEVGFGAIVGVEISGTVINHEGRPVAEAQVVASPARGHTGILPHTFTDAKGNFRIVGLNPESYFMEAQKESDGYASTFGTFHSAGLAEAPLISVAENQAVTGVILRFGPKSARLTGRIIDAKTKKSVEDAEIVLRRASNPRQFYSTSSQSKFNVLVPPVPFTIEVKSYRYEDWTYSNDGSGKHMDALRLASGQRRDLTIALHPK